MPRRYFRISHISKPADIKCCATMHVCQYFLFYDGVRKSCGFHENLRGVSRDITLLFLNNLYADICTCATPTVLPREVFTDIHERLLMSDRVFTNVAQKQAN